MDLWVEEAHVGFLPFTVYLYISRRIMELSQEWRMLSILVSQIRKANGNGRLCFFANIELCWLFSIQYSSWFLKPSLRLFCTSVFSVLLCGSNIWELTFAVTKNFQAFISVCLHSVIEVFWPKAVTNEELGWHTQQNIMNFSGDSNQNNKEAHTGFYRAT